MKTILRRHTKTCLRCKEQKPLIAFSGNKQAKDGKQLRCKQCSKILHIEWRARNPEKYKEYSRKQYKENKEKLREYHKKYRAENVDYIKQRAVIYNRQRDHRKKLLQSIKNGAKLRGIIVDIAAQDIVIPDKCPICEIQLLTTNEREFSNSPSVDRIDNAHGYVKGNIAVICRECNRQKNNHSVESLYRLIRYMEKQAA